MSFQSLLRYRGGESKCVLGLAVVISSDTSVEVCRPILYIFFMKQIAIMHAQIVDYDTPSHF